MVVADGILHYIPFAALADPAGSCTPAARFCPMIAGHEIVNLPSASVLDVIRREASGRPRAAKMVAVFSDPVFDAGDPRLGAAGRSGATPRFERLPYSRGEAESIAGLADPARTLKALDFDASRAAAARPELADYRFVHFATHGILDSERPELSGLVLSLVDRKGEPQDGFLRVHELYNLDLGAEPGRAERLPHGAGARDQRRGDGRADARLHVCRFAARGGQPLGRPRPWRPRN